MKFDRTFGHRFVVSALWLFDPSIVTAQTHANRSSAEPRKSQTPYVFSLLPKAFQTRPVLAISVVTDLTVAGRSLKPPTAQEPVYYYDFPSGYHHEGHGASEQGNVSSEEIKKLFQAALASSNYLPFTKDHPPTLVLFFLWGVHSKLDKNDLETGQGGFSDVRFHNLLSRAALVGGDQFAKELTKAIDQQSRSGGPSSSILDPVYLFTNRDDLTRNLMDQVLDDCYYVVISAYESAALARGERKLLWRTKMSTPAQGVSLVETTPALIASGRPFFGREMSEPSIVGKRINRDGKVEVGDLKFKGYEELKTAEPKPNRTESKMKEEPALKAP